MSAYEDLLRQKQELEQRIKEARKSQIADAVAEVRALIAKYDLTEKDVFHAMLKAFPLKSSRARLKWEPEVWFNSKRICY